ncbi:MAG: hypothetical protein LBI27_03145 [Clostridiales bacterium]|nr:hypothetical protein [Clostridiales bacterium]
MPEKLSYNKIQLKERPSIRKIAAQFLNDGLLAQLEPFLQYVEENKMPFSLGRCNTYESKYKTKLVFRVEIANGQACTADTYAVKVYTVEASHFREENREAVKKQLNDYLSHLEDGMADYFIRNVAHCRGCGKCKPGTKVEILGQQKTVCSCDICTLKVINPDETDYVMIKKFIDARKNFILQI